MDETPEDKDKVIDEQARKIRWLLDQLTNAERFDIVGEFVGRCFANQDFPA